MEGRKTERAGTHTKKLYNAYWLIAGHEGGRFVMHSTAWKGSSGSCVFDSQGNFIGVVFALSASQLGGHPVLLESMVWVEPYTSIDWAATKRFIKALN